MSNLKATLIFLAIAVQASWGYSHQIQHDNDVQARRLSSSDISQTQRSLRGSTPTISPTSSPSKHESNEPTAQVSNPFHTAPIDSAAYIIGESSVTIVGNNALAGKLQVQNEINKPVGSMNVVVELLDFDCSQSKPSSGLEVSLESHTDSSSPFIYDAYINEDKIGLGAGGFVAYEGNNKSKGSIQFCTRVSLYEGDIQFFFRDTRFKLNFDLTDNQFVLSNIGYDGSGEAEMASEFEASNGVTICQCDEDFSCYSDMTHALSQTEDLVVCIKSTPATDSSMVRIPNFNFQMSAGSISFSPVSLGSTTWEVDDPLTDVSEQDDVIKITTPLLAQFFVEGYDNVKITGTALLAHDDSEDMANFDMVVGLNVEQKRNCLKSLVQRMLS